MMEQDPLQPLETIRKVSAPDYLRSRVEARIQDLETASMPMRWQAVLGVAFAGLLAVNVVLLSGEETTAAPSLPELQGMMHEMAISGSNQLYDD
ncbi:MAG: hypothetical protein AAGB22_00320 [Bacteroidota bacterium]